MRIGTPLGKEFGFERRLPDVMAALSRPILVADGEETSRNRLAGALRESGFEALSARSGGEAVELARQRVVSISILDVALPGLSGLETYELIGSIRGPVQGIFLAKERTKDTLVRLLEAGAFTVLKKPPRLDWLLEAVRRLFARLDRETGREARRI